MKKVERKKPQSPQIDVPAPETFCPQLNKKTGPDVSLSLTIECFHLAEDTARPPCPRTSLSPTASTSLGRPQISGKKVIVPLSAVAPLCECYFPLYFLF